MDGYTIGTNKTDGYPLTLSDDERRRHIYIIGQTGSGKTSLLFNLIQHDLETGRGFALLDPHGDLAQLVADTLPEERIKDTLYFDPLDPTHVVGFNPLRRVSPLFQSPVASQIVAAHKHVWGEFWGPRLAYVLKNAVQLLLSQNRATLLDISKLLVDAPFRQRLVKKCDDPGVRFFWEEEYGKLTPKMQEEWRSPLQNKAGAFRTDAILRAVVGQPNSINVPELMNNRRVLIANLSKRMGEEPSHLLGALLTTTFAQSAEERAAIPEAQREDFTLYVDEFQNFTTETFGTILSEARKWRLNLVIANQFLDQLPKPIRAAVFGNVSTWVVFRVGAEDAPILSRELGRSDTDLTDTENFHAWVKRIPNGTPTNAQKAAIPRPAPGPGGWLPAVIEKVHARHAQPRAVVEKLLHARTPWPDIEWPS